MGGQGNRGVDGAGRAKASAGGKGRCCFGETLETLSSEGIDGRGLRVRDMKLSKSPRSDVVGKPSLRSGAAGEKCVTGKGEVGHSRTAARQDGWMDHSNDGSDGTKVVL